MERGRQAICQSQAPTWTRHVGKFLLSSPQVYNNSIMRCLNHNHLLFELAFRNLTSHNSWWYNGGLILQFHLRSFDLWWRPRLAKLECHFWTKRQNKADHIQWHISVYQLAYWLVCLEQNENMNEIWTRILIVNDLKPPWPEIFTL